MQDADFIEYAARELPTGYFLEVFVERGFAEVRAVAPDGEALGCEREDEERMPDWVRRAVAVAINHHREVQP